jgi:hypothetical protein
MSITFVDPRAEPGAPVEPYALRADLDAADLRIALLANGFPDSVNFLDQIEVALREVLPHATFGRWDKGDASSVASPEVLAEITATCQVAVAAYGH